MYLYTVLVLSVNGLILFDNEFGGVWRVNSIRQIKAYPFINTSPPHPWQDMYEAVTKLHYNAVRSIDEPIIYLLQSSSIFKRSSFRTSN